MKLGSTCHGRNAAPPVVPPRGDSPAIPGHPSAKRIPLQHPPIGADRGPDRPGWPGRRSGAEAGDHCPYYNVDVFVVTSLDRRFMTDSVAPHPMHLEIVI